MNYRPCHVTTLLGSAIYERAYYHCLACHHGHLPTDMDFRIADHQTVGASEVISLMGLLEPFEEGARKTLPRLTGMNVSASTVQRTTEAVGADVAERRDCGETFADDEVWDWHRDATGRKVAYVELDATGVRQQGPHAERAEGRMPWVGVVFNPLPMNPHRRDRRRRHCAESRGVSGLMSLEEIGQQLRNECRSVGLKHADVVIGLSDGGNGLENCLTNVVSGMAREVVFILDFWHASEHLQEFANIFVSDETMRHNQVELWCQHLKEHGGLSLIRQLQSLDLTDRLPPVTEQHQLLLNYLRSNQHRMDYPDYIRNGWQIGSGKVESSCKNIVGARLKCSGMRWRPYGTTPLCQLRALYKSEPKIWTLYWQAYAKT
ncbi:ISKra4 family transposase [Fuerstiella marisgermanici]|uniref:ISKra4 family transposase n=1 Tax=Fuerstiella marisgermanici TaxID=1891926 RepID=A0A1P8WCZ5_9PLAN|nr:ISKra4 family transposase [Fuerstiella marisgermanici]APZ91945.1 hypothetical protein Fuma_01546 [Fuerstiella marisgermanici]